MAVAIHHHGEGRPVVVLPWFSLDGAVAAEAFEPAFAGAAGWRRSYVDLPGTGDSPPVAANSDAVLDAVADALGPGPYLLAGASYGGYLAAGLARRHPERVAGLMLVVAGVKIDPARRNLDRLVASQPEPGWLNAVPQRWHEHFRHAIGVQTGDVAERVHRAMGDAAGSAYLDELRATGYRLSDEDEGGRVGYDGVTAIVTGTADRVAGYLDAFDALARYPNGSYHALDGAGHYLPFERPRRFAALVRDWLGNHAAR